MKYDFENLYLKAEAVLPSICLDNERCTLSIQTYNQFRDTIINVTGFEDDSDEPIDLARIRLKVGIYPVYLDDDELFAIVDAENVDSGSTISDILKYRKEIDCYHEDLLSEDQRIAIVELHELYIEPQYRGKGLSAEILFRLPNIIQSYFNIDCGYIGTYINPYRKQSTISEMPKYGEQYVGNKLDQETYKIMRRTIEVAGFRPISNKKKERHFVASMSSILEAAEDNDMEVETDFD